MANLIELSLAKHLVNIHFALADQSTVTNGPRLGFSLLGLGIQTVVVRGDWQAARDMYIQFQL